jgi:DNA-binding transcriptional MerR regulator
VIIQWRSVGLTIKEIKQLADAYLADRDEPVGPKIAAALDRAEQRIDTQIQELEALRRRIAAYRADNAAALAGRADFATHDPRAQHMV